MGYLDDRPDEVKNAGYYRRQLAAVQARIEKQELALNNCRLLAARNRKESWALLILGFCAEAGFTGRRNSDNRT